ncbi:MAG: hypothetical protein ABIJ16_13060 [Bacteroidota bacterium]
MNGKSLVNKVRGFICIAIIYKDLAERGEALFVKDFLPAIAPANKTAGRFAYFFIKGKSKSHTGLRGKRKSQKSQKV